MLFFFDETFRESQSTKKLLGALCGIGIPQNDLGRVAYDVFQLKRKHMGAQYAEDEEIKGKSLLSNWAFRRHTPENPSTNIALATDLIEYIVSKHLPIFGCVCFEKGLHKFQVQDVQALDYTFRFLFERIDMWMKINRPDERAILVFDDRDYGINNKNAAAITNFFTRSPWGLSMDSILRTPFFAISQAQNVGLQLADFVTTVIGLRFSSNPNIDTLFAAMKKAIPHYVDDGRHVSGLKVMRGQSE